VRARRDFAEALPASENLPHNPVVGDTRNLMMAIEG